MNKIELAVILWLLNALAVGLALSLAIMYVYHSITNGNTRIYLCAIAWSIVAVVNIVTDILCIRRWFRARRSERVD